MPQHEQITHTPPEQRCLACLGPRSAPQHDPENVHHRDYHEWVPPIRRGPLLMELNMELLRATRDRLLTAPDTMCDMRVWLQGDVLYSNEESSCGTTACLAGWILAVRNGKLTQDEEPSAGRFAAKALGLDEDSYAYTRMGLFFMESWPARYRWMASDFSNRAAMIAVLGAVLSGELNIAVNGVLIDNFVETPVNTARRAVAEARD